jgi:hypothetical protein
MNNPSSVSQSSWKSIRARPAADIESEMALFRERSPQCAQKELDTADIVRDGDISTATRLRQGLLSLAQLLQWRR